MAQIFTRMPGPPRTLLLACAGALLLVAAALLGFSCYYAGLLEDGALKVDQERPAYDLRVVSITDGRIELEAQPDASDDWRQDGLLGIEWPGGYARAGRILQTDGWRVVRELIRSHGALPRAGDLVRLDSFAYPAAPQDALNASVQEVTVTSDLGDFPAWLFAGNRMTWLISVHGMGSRREEAYRLLETTTALGYPALAITYRNDEGVARSRSGYYDYGRSEWRDLEAAVQLARSRGAQRVVLVGYSMGGGIVMAFMDRSPFASEVSALILDAPMLNFDATIDLAADRKGVPGPLTSIAQQYAALRFGIDWKALDYEGIARGLAVPVLLFHGDADPTVPVSLSDRLAADRPDIVSYHRLAGAAHVRSWNVDPQRYAVAVTQFLAELDGDE
jgi:pimeloyl-ACP methyl ester carboxylesterase